MNSLVLPIALQIAFFLLLLAEITIPSAGLLGIAAGAAAVASWVVIIGLERNELLFIFAGADLLLLPITIWIGIKLLKYSPLANRSELSAHEGFQMKIEFPPEWIGKEAVAYSTLRPSGHVKIEERIVEALSEGPMVEKGERVVILSIDENKLIVTPKENR